MAVMSLADFKKDAQGDINLMKSQKLGDHDAEIEKIKNNFLIILRDIKKSMASGEMPAESITADMMQKIWEQLKDKPREEITADDVADAIVLAVGKLDALGEKELEMVRQIAKQMLAGV
jgi:transcriptional regulator NrdR family protein